MKTCTKCNFETKEPKKYFGKQTLTKDGFKHQCKKCRTKINDIYTNTENGFMTNLYQSIKTRSNNIRFIKLTEEQKNRYRCYITKEKFFELWENHKKNFGYCCKLTGIKIICEKSKGKKGAGFLGYFNGVSVDRLDPNIGYTEDNIIFISNEANKNKGAVTKEMCIKILEIFKEKNL
jgi:hypothetical protein